MVKWHKSDLDNRMYLNIEDGKRISMMRYYKDKMYTDEERDRIAYVSRLRINEINEERIRKMIEDYGEDYISVFREREYYIYQKFYKDAEKGRDKI